MKRIALTLRKAHRFSMIFLAVQFMLWSFSGLYMVVMDIDFIHGDHLIKQPTPLLVSSEKNLSFQQVLQQYPQAKHLKLTKLAQRSVYQFRVNNQAGLISAQTGVSLLPFSKGDIAKLASEQSNLLPSSNIIDIRLLTDVAPAELSARHLPVWKVAYDDVSTSTLYISAATGQVVTKRHNYWRLFDVMWMLHIMDYENRSDITNWLLFVFSLTGIFSSLSGFYLLGHRFRFTVKFKRLFTRYHSRKTVSKRNNAIADEPSKVVKS